MTTTPPSVRGAIAWSTGGVVSALAVDAAIHFDAGGAVVELLALRWFFLPCGHPVTDLEGALCGWGCEP
jgi:hypothetical protein